MYIHTQGLDVTQERPELPLPECDPPTPPSATRVAGSPTRTPRETH
jgi:hypothetical protein